jgi:hypothetical protein
VCRGTGSKKVVRNMAAATVQSKKTTESMVGDTLSRSTSNVKISQANNFPQPHPILIISLLFG